MDCWDTNPPVQHSTSHLTTGKSFGSRGGGGGSSKCFSGAKSHTASRPRDAQRRFQFAGKLRNGLGNLVRLLRQPAPHPVGGLRPEADDFGGGNDQREIVVHVVAQAGGV